MDPSLLLKHLEPIIEHPRLHRALRYWVEQAPAGFPATLPEIDPLDVPDLLRYVYLMEKVGERFRYRLSGDAVNRLFERNLAGRFLDEVLPADTYERLQPFFAGVFEKQACFYYGYEEITKKQFIQFERLILPIWRNGQVFLFGCANYEKKGSIAPLRPGRQGLYFTVVDLKSGAVSREAR